MCIGCACDCCWDFDALYQLCMMCKFVRSGCVRCKLAESMLLSDLHAQSTIGIASAWL
jgi:hypothetical protein